MDRPTCLNCGRSNKQNMLLPVPLSDRTNYETVAIYCKKWHAELHRNDEGEYTIHEKKGNTLRKLLVNPCKHHKGMTA